MKTLPMIILLAFSGLGCDSIKKAVKESVGTQGSSVEGGAVHKLTPADFDEFTQQSGPLVVVDFYADWCGPCKRLAPMLDKFAEEFGDRVVIGKLDVDAYGEVAKRMGVRGIPDLRLYREGKQVDKIVGLLSESEMRSRLERHSQGAVVRPKTETGKDGQPEKKNEPSVQPMEKDWMPPGMERR